MLRFLSKEVTSKGKVTGREDDRCRISHDGFTIIVSKNANGERKNWVITAVDYSRSKKEKGITANPPLASHGAEGEQSSHVTPRNPGDKVDDSSGAKQEKGEKNKGTPQFGPVSKGGLLERSREKASKATGQRKSELAETVSEVKESMVVNMAYHANDPGAGMALHQSPGKFKMFAGDTGLFVTLAFWDGKFTDNTIYHKLLSDKLSADLGYVYENAVAQMLKAAGHELYYYTFPTESGKHNYEVDFLIAEAGKISPIEVKSSGYKRHASLDAFCRKFSARIRNKYLVYTKDLRKEEDVLCLPSYMAMFL